MANDAKITSVTKKTKDGKEVRISVREISNGWILRTTTEGKDAKGNWQYDEKEEYCKDNPLDPKVLKMDIIKEALGKS
jgi:hypothetical protein